MRRSPLVLLTCLAPLAASACNLIFGITSGEPATGGTGGGSGGGSQHDGGSVGGGGGDGGPVGGGGSGGAPSCTPNAASCEGAVLHACDATGHPLPDVNCDVVAACDAAARTCIEASSLPRLSVGDGRSCAIEPGGGVRCWGINARGGLVIGDDHLFLPSATPVPGVAKVRQISVGSSAQCYVDDDGAVNCWGYNDSGELGSASAGFGVVAKASLPAGAHAVEVSMAHRCACARIADGSVYCWGANDAGCIGNASDVEGPHPTPTLVPNVSGAVQIRTGSYGTPTCARMASGKVKCWGRTVPPTEVANIADAIDVTVGRHVVFIRSKSQGVLWTALAQDEKSWRDPAPYAITGDISAMDAGDAFCALRTDGVVTCALLGDGLPPPLPAPIPGQPAGTVVEIGAGYANAYAEGVQCLRLAGATLAGNVHCWGDDAGGALGAGGPDLFRTPQAISALTGVAAISAGYSSTSAVMTDGSVKVWGLAFGLRTQIETAPATVGFLGNDNASVSTSDPWRRAYVVKKSGALALLETATPKPNERLSSTGLADFADARDLGYWDVGRRNGGALVIHGALAQANDGGVYGNGTTTTTAPPENITLAAFSDVTAVAAYGDAYGSEPSHLCVIHGASSALACWGDNYHDEIGVAGAPQVVTSPATVAIPNGEAIVSVAAGRYFTCAASAAGKVYCWGSNDRGQLGDSSLSSSSVPNPVPGVSGAVGVTAGEEHACAWLADKTVMCWGANDSGQIGDGSIDDRPQATAVMGVSNVVAVSAGLGHTCALHGAGGVSCWGSSYSGQVGTGVRGSFAAPLPVVGL